MMYCLVNKIQTPDGTELHCLHRHDYKSYKDTLSNEVYVNDGEGYAVRRSFNTHPYVDLSVWVDTRSPDLNKEVREAKFWGSYGKDGKQKKTYLCLKEMENNHLIAILNTQYQIRNTVIEKLIKLELTLRGHEFVKSKEINND